MTWAALMMAFWMAVLPPEPGPASADEAKWQAALRTLEATPGRDELQVAIVLNNLAGIYRRGRKFPDAEAALGRAVAIYEAQPGPPGEDAGRAYLNFATLRFAEDRYAECEPLARRASKILEETLAPDDPDLEKCRSNFLTLMLLLEKYDEAEGPCSKRLGEMVRQHGPESPEAVQVMDQLASIYQQSGRDLDSEDLLIRALEIRRRQLGPDDPQVAMSLERLGHLDYMAGRYAEADDLLRKAARIRIVKERLPDDDPILLGLLNELGWTCKAQGRYRESEKLHRQALALCEARWGPDRVQLMTHLNGLAGLFEATGRYAEAEKIHRRALKIVEDRLGGDHPKTALSLFRLATLLKSSGRVAEAEPLYLRSLAIRERRLGPDHPDVGRCLDGLAEVETALGRLDAAERHLRRSREILESRRGPDHPHVASNRLHQAALLRAKGEDAEAEAECRRGLQIFETKLGPDHPDVAEAGTALATLLAARGEWGEAARQADRARRVIRRQTSATLPDQEEPEQLRFLKARDRPSFHLALSLALAKGDDPSIVALSSDWVLNGKGVALAALAKKTLQDRQATSPGLVEINRELKALRQRIAAQRLNPAGQSADGRIRLDAMLREERDLQARLDPSEGRKLDADPWASHDDVRRDLAGDSVLVEFVRVEPVDLDSRSPIPHPNPSRYAAWIIPPAGQGGIRLVDLGLAEPIDRAASEALKTAQTYPKDVAMLDGEAEAERPARERLRALASKLLDPLLPRIERAKHWVVSPDSALWLVPWSALVLPDGSYAVEGHRITLVVTGRALRKAAPAAPSKSPVVMADPDFDLSPADALAATTEFFQGPSPGSKQLALRDTPRMPSRFHAVIRLPGTAKEARAISGPLARLAGEKPTVYTGRLALEPIFKSLVSPSILVMSTHGFALDRPTFVGDGAGSDNPLLRCGLLLAGCNQGATSGDDDGILTGGEVVATDLRGTKLVVLSACRTALGEVRDGEGIGGLRQAFQLAGASAVVATLWSIPDDDSAALMAAFFDHLAKNEPDSEALRQAQIERIKFRRKHVGGAHPFFWAAYSDTGPASVGP